MKKNNTGKSVGGATTDIFKDLNDKQKLAVKTIDKPLFVFAGPSTRKTHVTTHKLAYMIDKLDSERIFLRLAHPVRFVRWNNINTVEDL